jgi:aminomethyltransferase
MKYYHSLQTKIGGVPALVSRTGYTGEDGFEVMLPAQAAVSLWQELLDTQKSAGATACGLGARDTLRLEAGMPLYGHELSEAITPWQAGLDFAVDLEGRTFTGREVLSTMRQAAPERVRVGLELAGKRVPREHFPIHVAERTVGEVTSGTFSPTLNKPIAMGYIEREHATVGTEVTIDVRGTAQPGRLVKLPFYKRPKK